MRLAVPSIPFKARIAWARCIGAAEGVWGFLWPAAPMVFVFCAIGMVGGWRAAPLWLHLPALIGVLGFTGWSLWRAGKAFAWPSRDDALVRLENASNLRHQPLRKRQNTAMHGDSVAKALWAAHLERMNAAKASVRAPTPQLSWLGKDRFGLTSLAILFAAVGLISAGARAPSLLAGSFVPDLGGAPSSAVVTVLATPPSYVGMPPILLSAFDLGQSALQDMALPEGTQLDITLQGGWRTPTLNMGDQSIALSSIGERTYGLKTKARASEGLRVRQGSRTQFEWLGPIKVDQPPAIAFSDVPQRTTNHALEIVYDVFDDYGVESANLILIPRDLPENSERHAIAPPNVEPGLLETRRLFKDLTPSKWAGTPVILTLEARDGLNQRGKSGPLEMILPERPFEHPVAKDIIQQRKRLFFEAGSRRGVANAMDDISRTPGAFDDSLWVFSMLRSAHYRLARSADPRVVDAVTEQLWEIANFIEDGGVNAQREALRKSLEEMMSALESEDAQAFDAMAQDLAKKIAELMAKQMQQMSGADPMPQMDGGEMRMIDSSTLERMMQQMRDLAAAGDMAGAMEMLQAIQSLMENLNASPGPSAESLAQAAAAQDALDAITALAREQRALMNQTVREALDTAQQSGNQAGESSGQTEQPGGQQPGGESGGGQGPGGKFGTLTQSQSGLQQDGQGIVDALGEAGLPSPDGLAGASENMGNAATQLGEGRGLPALREQADALRNLANAQSALEKQLNQMMQQIRAQSAGRDPFGRANGNNKLDNGRVKIPTEAEAKRARDIRDELQRRLGDPDRSVLERSYLRRLLERFSR